ncbi:hypothetical protein CgunFtcFv8_014462 [Champsocephalus gunnari]|uniref:Uncharacterized protein n=1 Tax=Champsocephalus gunnari TaxID=52237 RepID=A0AAN8E629_CHAGU|nr:hypothetical protein CgunFtcFv8_014462 [Champsocephalus gunnari]
MTGPASMRSARSVVWCSLRSPALIAGASVIQRNWATQAQCSAQAIRNQSRAVLQAVMELKAVLQDAAWRKRTAQMV